MPKLIASRFDITLTLLELDDDGEPMNEYTQQQHTLYGLGRAHQWLEELPARIAEAERQLQTAGGESASNGHNSEIRASVPRGD